MHNHICTYEYELERSEYKIAVQHKILICNVVLLIND